MQSAKAVDLSQVVRDMERMLRRVVPENTRLCTTEVEAGASVWANPGQLEQVLLKVPAMKRCRLQRVKLPGSLGLVLSEVVMPLMSGPEVVRRVREIHPEARAVFVSGSPKDLVQRTDLIGFPLLSKPFGPGQLLAEVAAILDLVEDD